MKLYHLAWISWHEWRGVRATEKMNNVKTYFHLSRLSEIREHHRRQLLYHLHKLEGIF